MKIRWPGAHGDRIILLFAPLILLALDFIAYPAFFETHTAPPITTGDLGNNRNPSYLGTFKAHNIFVSLDNMDSSDYLAFLTQSHGLSRIFLGLTHRGGNALAISVSDTENGVAGSLLSRVLHKLESLSPDDRKEIINSVHEPQWGPGNVMPYELKHIPTFKRDSFPLDRLLFLKFGEKRKESYLKGMPALLNPAQCPGLLSLILPCLGTNPGAQSGDWLSCSDTYSVLFSSLRRGDSPRDIYISFWNRWSDKTLEEETENLNSAWSDAIKKDKEESGIPPVIYRADIRLMLVFLSVCLLVCSRRIALTLRNFAIVCVSFLGIALGVQDKLVPWLLEVVGFSPAWLLKIILLFVLAVGYHFFVTLTPEAIFGTRHK